MTFAMLINTVLCEEEKVMGPVIGIDLGTT
jgi:hypothetical protein